MFGWRWLDRRLHRVAHRLTAAQFTALVDGPLIRPSMTPARFTTLTAAVVLLAGVLAIAGLGVWLVSAFFFSLATVFGVVLLGVAFLLRPRLGRLAAPTEDAVRLDPAAAPELFGLVHRVAVTVGAPAPDVVLLGSEQNAFTTTVGLRRRRVLCLGLPLWATLDPQERVALLGHELGHFVNGDVRRGPLTLVAETTLGRVADLFDPDGSAHGGILEILSRALCWVVSRIAFALHLLLVWTSQRDSQRAEYFADELGARAAGTAAAVSLADHMLITDGIDTVIRREARAGNGARAWHAAARTARTNRAPDVPLLRQLSNHTGVSLFASHPPTGLRADMLERRARCEASVTLPEAVAARIDEELSAHDEGIRRKLAEY